MWRADCATTFLSEHKVLGLEVRREIRHSPLWD
jgi:hypothetical protein